MNYIQNIKSLLIPVHKRLMCYYSSCKNINIAEITPRKQILCLNYQISKVM